MAEPDVWRCSRCGWEYPNKHPNAKHRRNHKKKCGKPVQAAGAAAGAAGAAGIAAVAPGGSSSDDALSDDDEQEEQGHVAIASSNGSTAAPHSANTHIEASGTATGGDGEQERRAGQADVGVLEAGDEAKAGHHQNGGGPEPPDEIQEDGHAGASANDDPVELARPGIKEPVLVASAGHEAVEQKALTGSKLPENKGDPAEDSEEVGELWELLLDAEEQGQGHVSDGGPHSANPHIEAPRTATVGEGTAEDEGEVPVEREQTAVPAEKQSSAVASKLPEDKGDPSFQDAARQHSLENQEVRELWEQLLEADLAVKNNSNNQIGGLDAAPVAPAVAAPIAAPSEPQQIQPGYLQQSVSPVPGPASLVGGSETNGTNPFLGDGGRQQIEQPQQSSKETWKAFPTFDDDNNGSNVVANPFVGSEGFRASKVDESDIKPHFALQSLFETEVKRVEGSDLSPLVDAKSEAWVKSSKSGSSSKKPRSRWSSFICCVSQR